MRSALRLAFCSLALLACSGLTGCNYRNQKDTYYLIAVNGKLPYWKTAQDGFKDAAAQYGVTARVTGPESYDPQAEVAALRDAIAARPAGILISAANGPLLQPVINEAMAAGIPVITIDSDSPFSSRLFFIGTNNIEAGRVGGRRLVSRLGGKGNVVFLSIPDQPNLEERFKGYKELLADNPGIRIAGIVNTGASYNTSLDSALEYAGRTGAQKIDAFVCLESEGGKAVAEALKRNHLTDRTLIAMDIDPDTLALIKAGVIDSTVSQRPYTMGYLGLKMLDETHHSHKGDFLPSYAVSFKSGFPIYIDTGSSLITQTNSNLYEHPIQELTQY